MPMRKPPAPVPSREAPPMERGTQNKVPLTVWLDPVDKERVATVARRRDLGVSVFGARALMAATTMAEQQDALEAQLPVRRIAL